MSAEHTLARLAHQPVQQDRVFLAKVTQVSPLLVRPDGDVGVVGPIATTAGVSPAVNAQVMVWQNSTRFVCIGVVTNPIP